MNSSASPQASSSTKLVNKSNAMSNKILPRMLKIPIWTEMSKYELGEIINKKDLIIYSDLFILILYSIQHK